MNFFVFCVCMFNSATKLESPSLARAIIASLEEGSSTSLFPEKSQGNPTTVQDSSETTQDDSSNERPVTAGSCPFFLVGMFLSRLRAVSPFSWSVEQKARDTQMTMRVTEGARRVSSRAGNRLPRFSRLAASPLYARGGAHSPQKI